MFKKIILANLLFLTTANCIAKETTPDYKLFHDLFTHWATAFNQKDLKNTCALFSTHLKADYQGTPAKNYQTICNGFKSTFADSTREYHYRFKINDIYRSGNMAAVRITWYLDIYANHERMSVIRDEGLDILEKNAKGEWQIVNYLAYEANAKSKPVEPLPELTVPPKPIIQNPLDVRPKENDIAPTPSIPMI